MTKKYVNPALQEESIGEPPSIIVPRENESLLRWLKSTGRFMSSQSDRFSNDKEMDELEDILAEDEEKDLDE
ncbi:MAG: DUF3134 family protein [Cyanobacteria bacterium P01_G01_bin.39]